LSDKVTVFHGAQRVLVAHLRQQQLHEGVAADPHTLVGGRGLRRLSGGHRDG